MNNLTGNTYLILGASSGIGKNIAEFLTKEKGANVVLVARRKEIIAQMAEELPGVNYAIPFDLAELEKVSDIIKECETKHIPLDGMVYAAGIAPLFSIQENDNAMMLETVRVNALAFAALGKELLNYRFLCEDASVVAISSIVSLVTTNRQSAYAASKAMLNTYVAYMAKEAIGKLRVNTVLPGVVETEMFQKLREKSPNLDERTIQNQPLGIIPPEAISKMVAFLLSKDAEYITGSQFKVDAGFML